MVPKLVYIVPYRNRESELKLFLQSKELPTIPEYEIFVAHQCDSRPFNRGAMRNIGFLAVKTKYPDYYRDITFVFNNVDTYTTPQYNPNYITTVGTVKHFYGFTYTLGGIFSITGSDFEKVNGYPNFWAWGYEDNALNNRCIASGIKIDRTDFVNLLKPEPNWETKIVNHRDKPVRDMNYGEFRRYLNKTTEGLADIHNLSFELVPFSENGVQMVNVKTFDVATVPNKNIRVDLTRGNPFKKLRRPMMQMQFT